MTLPVKTTKKKRKASISCYRTMEPGSIVLIIRKDTKNNNFENLIFLIDHWKIGLKDFFINNLTLKHTIRKFTQTNPDLEFVEISKRDAAFLLARGLEIANNVGTRIEPLTKRWLEKLGIPNIKLTGSLYKCYLCEENDLSEDTNKKILKIAKKEYKKGIAGTPRESYLFHLCKECES